MKLIVIVCGLFLGVMAQAAPVTWTINNAAMNDGGVVTGSFDYDAVTDVMSNVNIVSTTYNDSFLINSSNIDSGGYCSIEVCGLHAVGWVASTESPNIIRDFGFYLDAPLTNAGGSIAINTLYDVRYNNVTFDLDERNLLYPTTATITAVPIPAAVWLFGSALAGMGWIRRRTAT